MFFFVTLLGNYCLQLDLFIFDLIKKQNINKCNKDAGSNKKLNNKKDFKQAEKLLLSFSERRTIIEIHIFSGI